MTRIAKIKFTDILGIEELEFTAGQWNEITGGNGAGKTSIIEGLKALFGGGYDATLIRKGAERGEIVAVLDNGATLRKRIGKGQGLTIEREGVRQKGAEQTTIDGWLDRMSVNPVEFLKAKPDKRAGVLLETMPIEVDVARIRQIIGQADYQVASGHALEQLKGAYDEVFAQRRETNRAFKDKEATISQLSQTLPAAGEVPTESEAELEEQLKVIDEAKDAEDQRIDTKLGGLKVEHEAAVDALREEIAALRTQIAEKETAIATAKEAWTVTEGRANTQRQIKAGKWRETRQPLVDQVNLIRANREASVRAQTTRETIAKLRAEANNLEADSGRQSAALEAIVAYKSELLASLPIPGLEVKDGDLFRDGVPFDRLNKAQQAGIAIEIAKLRAGDLRVVCVDELEMLDSEHRDELIRLGAEADLQFFVTRVSDEPLAINAQ